MLYIHIPFCHSKCSYCDFYSTPGFISRAAVYIESACREIDLRRNEINGDIRTVYIGGGTPSIISQELIQQLFDKIKKTAEVSTLDEFTIEVNPEDVTPQLLDFYHDNGVTRISMGVQSLIDGELKAVSRRHDSATALRSLRILKDSELEFSTDLIYGLPGQTLQTWKESIDGILSYEPGHFSAYLLSYEPGTVLTKRMERGEVTEADEQTVTEMYTELCRQAAARGYDHYEISNFGKPGKHAVHNSRYWEGVPYLGIGPGAHSFDGEKRRYNPSNLTGYLKHLQAGTTAFETEEENDNERFNDMIITRLRTSAGISLDRLDPESRRYLLREAAPLVESGAAEISDNHLRIPESRWLTADDVMRHLIRT